MIKKKATSRPKATKKKKAVISSQKRKRGNPNFGEQGKQYRFKKGQSGNPAGRAQGQRTMAKQFRDQLTKSCSKVPRALEIAIELGLPKNTTIGQVFALKLIIDAMEGKEGIAKEIINRIDGKVPEVIRNEIIEEAKASLDNVPEDQLRKMLKKKLTDGSS